MWDKMAIMLRINIISGSSFKYAVNILNIAWDNRSFNFMSKNFNFSCNIPQWETEYHQIV
jgi:hypothetical protein